MSMACSGGCETGLPGKFGDQISDAMMSPGVEPFGATGRMSQIVVTFFLPSPSRRPLSAFRRFWDPRKEHVPRFLGNNAQK